MAASSADAMEKLGLEGQVVSASVMDKSSQKGSREADGKVGEDKERGV